MIGDIKPGDLVMVVRPRPCCGDTSRIGMIARVLRIELKQPSVCSNCDAYIGSRDKAILSNGLNGNLSVLKKIDPPSEGNALHTRKELNQPTEVM